MLDYQEQSKSLYSGVDKNEDLGPVTQSPIKLILDKCKILIAFYLPLKKGFSQD